MNEFKELVDKAQRQLGNTVHVAVRKEGWSVYKSGAAGDDVYNGTFDQCIAKLKEWATPPKPETITITIPYSHAVSYSLSQFHPQLRETCLQALKPYEV